MFEKFFLAVIIRNWSLSDKYKKFLLWEKICSFKMWQKNFCLKNIFLAESTIICLGGQSGTEFLFRMNKKSDFYLMEKI